MTNSPLLTNLYHHQSWRNSMQLYLQGATAEDRIKILVSHQPSSEKHNLSQQCRESVIRDLMKAGNEVDSWERHTGATEHSTVARYLIGGDLNTTLTFLELMAGPFTKSRADKTCHQQSQKPKHGDHVIDVNMNLILVDCQVKNHDPNHEIVLASFPWPSSQQDAPHVEQEQRPPLRGAWAERQHAVATDASLTRALPDSGAAEHVKRARNDITTATSSSSTPTEPNSAAAENTATSGGATAAAATATCSPTRAVPISGPAQHAAPAAAISNPRPAVPVVCFADVHVSLSDEETSSSKSHHSSHDHNNISEDKGWQDAYTLMMLYRLICPQEPGAVNCFDASKEPQLLVTQACNRPSHHSRPIK